MEAGPSKHHSKNGRGSMLRDKSKNSGSRLVLRNNSRIERSSNSKMERSGHSESRLSVGRRSISGRRVK